MKFEALGPHIHLGKTLSVGQIFESDIDLTKVFPKRFKRILSPAELEAGPLKDVKFQKESDGGIGSLVTERFNFDPIATGLQVYKKRKLYFIHSISDMRKPLNKEGLTRAEVIPFIKSQTAI